MSFLLGQKRYGIIFDLDNTLVPTAICYRTAKLKTREFLTKHCNLSPNVASNIIESYNEFSSHTPIDPSAKLNIFQWRKGLIEKAITSHTTRELDSGLVYEQFKNAFFKEMLFSEELKSILLELRKSYKLAILTNGDSLFQRTKLKACDADKYFDATIVSGEHCMMKPDPRLFHLTCRKIGVENRNCVMVGDTVSTDIIGAQKSGLKAAILVKNDDIVLGNDLNCKPDFFISSVADVRTTLKSCGMEE